MNENVVVSDPAQPHTLPFPGPGTSASPSASTAEILSPAGVPGRSMSADEYRRVLATDIDDKTTVAGYAWDVNEFENKVLSLVRSGQIDKARIAVDDERETLAANRVDLDYLSDLPKELGPQAAELSDRVRRRLTMSFMDTAVKVHGIDTTVRDVVAGNVPAIEREDLVSNFHVPRRIADVYVKGAFLPPDASGAGDESARSLSDFIGSVYDTVRKGANAGRIRLPAGWSIGHMNSYVEGVADAWNDDPGTKKNGLSTVFGPSGAFNLAKMVVENGNETTLAASAVDAIRSLADASRGDRTASAAAWATAYETLANDAFRPTVPVLDSNGRPVPYKVTDDQRNLLAATVAALGRKADGLRRPGDAKGAESAAKMDLTDPDFRADVIGALDVVAKLGSLGVSLRDYSAAAPGVGGFADGIADYAYQRMLNRTASGGANLSSLGDIDAFVSSQAKSTRGGSFVPQPSSRPKTARRSDYDGDVTRILGGTSGSSGVDALSSAFVQTATSVAWGMKAAGSIDKFGDVFDKTGRPEAYNAVRDSLAQTYQNAFAGLQGGQEAAAVLAGLMVASRNPRNGGRRPQDPVGAIQHALSLPADHRMWKAYGVNEADVGSVKLAFQQWLASNVQDLNTLFPGIDDRLRAHFGYVSTDRDAKLHASATKAKLLSTYDEARRRNPSTAYDTVSAYYESLTRNVPVYAYEADEQGNSTGRVILVPSHPLYDEKGNPLSKGQFTKGDALIRYVMPDGWNPDNPAQCLAVQRQAKAKYDAAARLSFLQSEAEIRSKFRQPAKKSSGGFDIYK